MINPETYKNYYNRIDIKFEMVKLMREREVCFLDGRTTIRCAKIHTIDYFNMNWKNFKMGDKYFPNFYISVAKYNLMPFFSFDLNERYNEQKIFRGSFENFVIDYDLFIDVDMKGDFEETYKNAKLIYFLFKEFIPFSIRFSGNGFHIIVDEECFDFIPLEKRVAFHKYFLNKLINMIGLNKEVIDINVIQKRRVYKVPYSLDVKSGRVCYPLTEEEFLNFKYDLVMPENIPNARNRGVPKIQPEIFDVDFFKKFYDEKEFKDYCKVDRTSDSSIIEEITRGV